MNWWLKWPCLPRNGETEKNTILASKPPINADLAKSREVLLEVELISVSQPFDRHWIVIQSGENVDGRNSVEPDIYGQRFVLVPSDDSLPGGHATLRPSISTPASSLASTPRVRGQGRAATVMAGSVRQSIFIDADLRDKSGRQLQNHNLLGRSELGLHRYH